jgi:hypothetical protein
MRARRDVVGWLQQAAARRLHAQQLEVVSGDDHATDQVDAFTLTDADGNATEAHHVRQHPGGRVRRDVTSSDQIVLVRRR